MKFLFLQKTAVGKGIFTRKTFAKEQKILDFSGPIVAQKDVPPINKPEDDRFIQIGPDIYIGPSEKLDDFVNHSCNPNTAVIINGTSAWLIALRTIAKDEEITFDYATTMYNDPQTFSCKCGEKNCRKVIREFQYLPQDVKEKYSALGILPFYIITTPSSQK